MDFMEANPLPQVCQDCVDREVCLAGGEGEWCCDECDHLGERFLAVEKEAGPKAAIEERRARGAEIAGS